MSARISAAQRRLREEAARSALDLENAQSLASAIALSEELAAENALLRQQVSGIAQHDQPVPVNNPAFSSPLSTTTQIVSTSQLVEDIPMLEMQIQIESAHKRLREFEQQAEMARKRTSLREELAMLTKKLLEFENPTNQPVTLPIEVYSSSSNGNYSLSIQTNLNVKRIIRNTGQKER